MADNIIVEIQFTPSKAANTFNSVEKEAAAAGTKSAVGFSVNFSKAIKKSMNNVKASIGSTIGAFLAFNTVKNVLSASASAAIEFEKSIKEINTILPNNTRLTEEQTKSLRALSRQYGTSASSQAKAFYQIISAGVTDTAKATELLAVANKLSIGGLTSTEKAIDILTTTINAYGAENLSAQEAADSLFTAVRLGKTTVDELASSLGSAIPIAKSAGINIDEVNAAVATLTTRGNSTSEAVTKVNAVLSALSKNGAKLGPTMDIAAVKSDGLVKVLQRLQVATGGSSAKLFELFGRQEAVIGIQTLAERSASQLTATIEQFTEKTGAADKAFSEFKDSLDLRINKLKSNISDLAITFGNKFTPAVVAAGEAVVRLVRGLTRTEEPKLLNVTGRRINELEDTIDSLLQKRKILEGEKEGKGVGLFRSLFGDVEGEISDLDREISLAESEIFALKAQRQEFRDQELAAQNQARHQSELERINRELDEKERLETEKLQAAIARKRMLQEKADKENAARLQKANAVINNVIGRGITRSIQTTVDALHKGQNAFKAFGDSILNLFADLATQLGQFYIAEGIAKLALLNANPGAQIAAGAGLIAVGQIIKSSLGGGIGGGAAGGGGGGGSLGGGAAGGGDSFAPNELAAPGNIERAQEQTALNLTVEGSLVRESELNGYVSELLEEGGRKNATIIPSLRTA